MAKDDRERTKTNGPEQRISQTANRTEQTAANLADQAEGEAGKMAEQVQQKAGDLAEQAQQTAGQVMDQVQYRAASALDEQKTRAAEGLGSVAQALRTSSHELRNQQQSTVAHYTERLASQVEQASLSLQDKNVEDIVRDVENLARRQPELFIGGALALGLIASRFLKSSSRPQPESYYSQRMEQPATTYSSPYGTS